MDESKSPSQRISRPFHLAGIVLISWLAVGCTDNATKLSHAIEHATEASRTGVQKIVYTPKSNADLPYFLVFFPEHKTNPSDLEAAGLPRSLTTRIFQEMAYLPIGDLPFLVVVQENGGLSFTTHWRQFASVPEVLVIPAEGPVELVLTSSDRGTIVKLAE